jgi:phenylacetate-CoA ligase
MRRMERLTGRSDDMMILRGVNVFPTQIEEALLATDWCSGHYLIELTRDDRLDQMTVLAEARPEVWGAADLDRRAEHVVAAIKNTIGVTVRVIIQAPGTIERSAGKARRVIDRRPTPG